MTGPLLVNRQMSSNAGTSSVDKTSRPKLRRCSSADEHKIMEPIPDDRLYKTKRTTKGDETPSDIDSGTEDLEIQMVRLSTFADLKKQNEDADDNQSLEFGGCDDEGYDEYRQQTPVSEFVFNGESQEALIRADLEKAASIPHESKKTFCLDTVHVFHAEFFRLIGCPIALLNSNYQYRLCSEEELPDGWYSEMNFHFVRLDNAKAQFKCTGCERLWTSMRARIAFSITAPRPDGWIVVTILGQDCQNCHSPADALWYMEEVCRVMENLANAINQTYFPGVFPNIENSDNEATAEGSNHFCSRVRHDPKQRKGKMNAQHDQTHCEACKRGWCFPGRV